MRYFVIRHKPTGFLMPQSSRKRWGYTHDDPTDPNHICPRLFIREQDAKTALTWWLKGVTSKTWTKDWLGEVDEVWSTDPVTSDDGALYGMVERKVDDMEVVPVEITLT